MAQEVRFDQFAFTVGEVDARIESRPDWLGYYKGAKAIRNCQVIPQGGVQRRWGTTYVDTCAQGNPAVPNQYEMCTMQFDDGAQYLITWQPSYIQIYLENVLVANISLAMNTPNYLAEDIQNLRFCQVEDTLVVTNVNFAPAQLVRSADAANNITAIAPTSNTITVNTALQAGAILPVSFTTTGTLPTTFPQIYVGRNYFIRATTTTTIRVFSNSADAAANVNFYLITALGANSQVVTRNAWTLSYITFINFPAYDFNGGYSALTFTPSATSGNAVTVTASAPIYTADMVGGLYEGGGGVLRILVVNSTTVVTGYTIVAFDSTNAIEGAISFLGEPAWSAARGYPKFCTYFQNRLVLAGSYSLANAVWLSVVNSAVNFDDSQAVDDDAIAWYPAGGSINVIVGVTSARSLLIHTSNGTFSTPLLNEAAVTPTNFTLTEQNKFSVQPIQPIFIDNQIIFVDTASNVINMIWDIAQSAFITNNISVMSSDLINFPVDMASFYEPKATDGFYALFVNADGTLAVYQTLHEQGIGAWSLMSTATTLLLDQVQNYQVRNSSFIHVISGGNRCWFLIQRQIPIASAGVTITAVDSNFLTAVAHGLTIGGSNLISFTTTGSLPTSNPQINTTEYWFARGLTVDTFAVYTDSADAANDTNRVTFSASGVNSKVVPWPLTYQIYVEELTFSTLTDSASVQTLGAPNTTVSNLSWLNGNVVNVKADGYLLKNETVFNGSITTEYAGTNYEVGLNYIAQLIPLPLSLPEVFGILYKPKHIKALYVRYYQSIGFTVQGYNIPIQTLQQQTIGTVPQPQNGVILITPMEGWDSLDVSDTTDIIIQQAAPLPMTILGLSYVLEV